MDKQEKIVQMFDEIAPTYDIANKAISFGVDHSWRKSACILALQKLNLAKIDIVDVACGTGDMMGVWQECAPKYSTELGSVIGVDPSAGMLEVAKKKFPSFKFINKKAHETTLPSSSADILSISYGIRNVIDKNAALSEFNRVVKLGGYLVVLEFTKRQNSGFIAMVRDFYISKILPFIGGVISKNKEAYEYLPNSIGNFLDKDSFCKELRNFGFEVEVCKGYSFDVSTLFLAKKVKNL